MSRKEKLSDTLHFIALEAGIKQEERMKVSSFRLFWYFQSQYCTKYTCIVYILFSNLLLPHHHLILLINFVIATYKIDTVDIIILSFHLKKLEFLLRTSLTTQEMNVVKNHVIPKLKLLFLSPLLSEKFYGCCTVYFSKEYRKSTFSNFSYP